MWALISDAWGRTINAAELVADRAASIDPAWAALGVALHLVSQVVRTRGWHTILLAAYPDATELRPRHTCAAYLAGSGLNAVIPARGGDVVKLWLLHRRIDDSRYTTLAATFVPETLFETLFGIGLVVWALANGFLPVPKGAGTLPDLDVSFVMQHPILTLILLGGTTLVVTMGVRFARRRIGDLAERLRQGVTILGEPRHFITGVASWQALSRLIRLGSLAAFMTAFALPVTLATVVLVMAAQGGGRIIPIAPASAGLRLAMLAYGFAEVTGQVVDIASITAFTVGVGAMLLVAGLLAGAVALFAELGTLSPRRAWAAIGSARDSRPAPAGTGR